MPAHGTMSNAEAKQRQNYEKNQLLRRKYNKVMKTYKLNKSKNNTNLNNEPAYPVNLSAININVGNSQSSRASSAANMYNIIDRSRHKAMWNSVLKSRKSKTRKQRGRGNDERLTEETLLSNEYYKQLSKQLQEKLLQAFHEAQRMGLNTVKEFDTIMRLGFSKAGIIPLIR
jgi:hypothetical protein